MGTRHTGKTIVRRPPGGLIARAEEDSAFALLQPWFLPKKIRSAITRLLPREYLSRMRWMFEDYGCFICGRKAIPYGGNGFCRTCRYWFRDRMIKSMKKRLGIPQEWERPRQKVRFVDRTTLAQELISDLAPNSFISFKKQNTNQEISKRAVRTPRIGPNGPRPRNLSSRINT